MSHKNLYSWNHMLSGYAKLGMLKPARKLFDKMPQKDVVSWNTMVIGYAKAGVCGEGLNHSGLVEEGLRVFESMTMVDGHGIVPDDEHYACLIDLLGRGGDFENLANQLRMLPCEPSERIWNSLLGVCSIHGNMELGKMAAGQLMKMQPGSPAAHLLLSSVYGELGRWDLVEKVREVMERRQVRKEQGLSWIEKGSSLQQTSMAAAEEEEEEEAF
ncbi:Pentatricopeptide repeat-containing protein At2g21090 [Linum perenne]